MIINIIKDALAQKAPLKSIRSSKWASVRKVFLKDNPFCACCGEKINLEVHHIKPFYSYPELELDLTNLITLCEKNSKSMNCHLFIGHLGNYKKINPYIHKDIKTWSKRYKSKKCLV